MQELSLSDKKHIQSTELFSELKKEELIELYNTIQICEFKNGMCLLSQGDEAKSMFVLLEGKIEVYIVRPSGEHLVLATLDAGDILGEDALDFNAEQKRSANAIAITNVRVAEIPKDFFQRHHRIQEKLSAHRLMHNYERMLKLIHYLHFIKLTPEEISYIQKETYQAGEIIFSQSDDAATVYFIINGLVRIVKKKGEKEIIIAKLSEGQCFGELAILEEQKRSATAIAEQETHLLKIDKILFLKWHNAHPIFRDMLHSLKQIYHLKDDSVVSVYTGKFKGKDCISTARSNKNGDNFISTKILNEETVLFYKLVKEDEDKIQRFVYTSTKDNIKRELQILRNNIIGVIAQGHWLRLGEIIHNIIKEKQIHLEEAELFQRTGEIFLEQTSQSLKENSIVCKCLRLSYKDIHHYMNLYGSNLEKIISSTGASLVCGSCKNMLVELVEKSDNENKKNNT